MGKNKLQRFAETTTFKNFVQPEKYFFTEDFYFKGNWCSNFFKNNNALYLELGCGKGEYTVGLARIHPYNNYLGVDIKGARMWRGAKTALNENIENAGFLRIRINQISRFFAKGEVNGIWITFPDPQPKQAKAGKRLTSPEFLEEYKKFLKPGAIIHLKTDNLPLFDYTLEIIEQHHHKLLMKTYDLYSESIDNEAKNIQTFYEKMFLAEDKKICYLQFCLSPDEKK
ncbi:MAG: tRNA (guanosine(46)-N7)-methyltransferase TrmB [Bacteroidales bacterium]|nr:tRNA (guanosine(46)-N7)-methyltransferase TrmB [Bacteroidales bacterium]MDD4213534.1 tRNA (guanosine(46)-N7)-methyltransferase TrmB [Bacteroidales bacterium]